MELAELLREKLGAAGVWVRYDKELRSSEGFDAAKDRLGGAVDGPLDASPTPLVFIEEAGVRFGVDLLKGQKTGFYLDQRENRAALAKYAAGRSVLDVFCYTGGFGLAAVVAGGTRQVLGIDSSASALASAKANAELNGVGERLRYEKSAAFPALERLRREGARFDAVVLDPPKLAKSRLGLGNAMRAYHSLNRLAVELLSEDGLLATCSCSGHVTRDMFEEMLSTVAAATGRRIQILEARGQAPDHPVSAQCLESSYLKCYLCRAT
jgi:23S rRNA (cytosine1962-C5)-methyltransferase